MPSKFKKFKKSYKSKYSRRYKPKIASMVKKVVKRMFPVEFKYKDTINALDYSASGGLTSNQYIPLNIIGQGTGGEQRIGDQIAARSVTIGLSLRNYQAVGGAEGDYANDTTLRTDKRVFWALIVDKTPDILNSGGAFDYTQVWEDVIRVPRFRVRNYQNRYTILKQGMMVVNPSQGRDQLEKTIYVKFNKPLVMSYDTSSTSSSESHLTGNKLIFFCYRYSLQTLTDENEILSFDMRARLRYSDV